MIYIDSSSLLKLFWLEQESEAVREHVAAEPMVLVSTLTELETESQLTAGWLAGRYGKARRERYRAKLAELRGLDPFRFRALPGAVFETALALHAAAGRGYCRTLGRLHLAAMKELEVERLLTHDAVQASAARALGFTVISPVTRTAG